MPWTMIAASIGAQLFNSWQANKKTEELQARQREFQRAAQQKDFDRMRQLQREAAQLALEIEADVHKQRLEDIETNYDDVVKQYSTEIAIKKWPLKVLPFVMRGESFGTFFNGTKSIALHVILTPSNCDRFNEAVYTDIDLQLEASCNQHWNTQSSHPIAYYGGAWRKSCLDLDYVDLLKTQLKNVPTVVITPYFSPNLYFKVQMWGMGKDTDVKIVPANGVFSYEDDYIKGMDYSPMDESPKGDLIDTTVEEFVPYLESLIGFIADKYYWEMYNVCPKLPTLIQNRTSNLTLISSSFTQEYNNIALQAINEELLASKKFKEHLDLLLSISPLLTKQQIESAYKIFRNNCCNLLNIDIPITIYPNSNAEISEIKTLIDSKLAEYKECEIKAFLERNYIHKKVEIFDLLKLVESFEKHILLQGNRIDEDSLSLYIEQENYKIFKIHLYNAETKKIIIGSMSFDFKFHASKIRKEKIIKDLFHYKQQGQLICRLPRIEKLKNILLNNQLVY